MMILTDCACAVCASLHGKLSANEANILCEDELGSVVHSDLEIKDAEVGNKARKLLA